MYRLFLSKLSAISLVYGILGIGAMGFLLSCSSGTNSSGKKAEAVIVEPPVSAETPAKSRAVESVVVKNELPKDAKTSRLGKGEAPEGMIYIPGGQLELGSETGLPR